MSQQAFISKQQPDKSDRLVCNYGKVRNEIFVQIICRTGYMKFVSMVSLCICVHAYIFIDIKSLTFEFINFILSHKNPVSCDTV